MKRIIIETITSVTMWAALAALAGTHIGFQYGYARGARDVVRLVIMMRDADEPPSPFTSGRI